MKFWKVQNEAKRPELLFYGEITSGEAWLDDHVTAGELAQTLEQFGGAPLTVRINSAGGDVFAANNIYAQLKAYKGRVTVYIDGLAASAATIIAAAGDRVVMPINALMMIHNPAIGLSDYLTAEQLTRYAKSLETIKDSILNAYQSKCRLSRAALSKMMDNETWLTAEECLDYGFADRISGRIDMGLEGGKLSASGRSYSVAAFADPQQLAEKFAAGGGRKESLMTKLEQILAKFGLLDEIVEPVADLAADCVSEPVAVDAEAAVAAERQRVADLEALRCGNRYIDAIVAAAQASGRTVDEAKPYVDALAALPPEQSPAQTLMSAVIADNLASGVDSVAAAASEQRTITEQEKTVDFLCGAFQKLKGGK